MKISYRWFSGILFLSLAFVLAACGNLKLQNKQNISIAAYKIPKNLFFEHLENKAIFKINILAFHQKISGILLVKQEDASALRLLMVTEFGLKVFDVTYYKDQVMEIHYVMKHLDNPYITNALFDNLKIFWLDSMNHREGKFFYSKKKKVYLYQLEKENEKWLCFFNQAKEINEIQRFNNNKKRAFLLYNKKNDEVSIQTKHPEIYIRIKKITHAE